MKENNLSVKRKYPYCGNEISTDANECQYCSIIVDYKNKDKKFTNLQPIWQLVILNIFTLGLYNYCLIEIGNISGYPKEKYLQ